MINKGYCKLPISRSCHGCAATDLLDRVERILSLSFGAGRGDSFDSIVSSYVSSLICWSSYLICWDLTNQETIKRLVYIRYLWIFFLFSRDNKTNVTSEKTKLRLCIYIHEKTEVNNSMRTWSTSFIEPEIFFLSLSIPSCFFLLLTLL